LKKNIQLKKNKENEPNQPTLTCPIHDPVSRDMDNPIKKHKAQFSINPMLKGKKNQLEKTKKRHEYTQVNLLNPQSG